MIEMKYAINVSVKNNNAPADGESFNSVSVICLDNRDFKPVAGLEVILSALSIGGTAFFKETDTTVYPAITNSIGLVTADIADTVAENIVIKCHVKSDPISQHTAALTFRKPTKTFEITRAANLNRTFLYGEPTVSWAGAEFTLYTDGGSGDIEWSTNNITSEVTIRPNANQSASIMINADPGKNIRIIAKDRVTGESDAYSFYLHSFIQSDRQKHTFSEAKEKFGDYLLPVSTYENVFSQWGNLMVYYIWSTAVDDTYWTRELIPNSKQAGENVTDEVESRNFERVIVFDVKTGVKSIANTLFNKKYFMYAIN
ncbi:MAG TPA: hypothetical protein DD649_16010 [Providencia sp.]|uniref:hypothetical protein n=1 Tax=unclassified Providencia TaxID=2633465 RepID=UPI000E86FE8E|nr:hypothetical protein [Providencia sp.]MBP6081488.1 hypothetical protein [Providencia sp.]HBO24371.1 hypothetical protein [Providencia sp.]